MNRRVLLVGFRIRRHVLGIRVVVAHVLLGVDVVVFVVRVVFAGWLRRRVWKAGRGAVGGSGPP